MFKRLLILVAFSLITACAGNAVNDDLLQAAEESYNDASTVINKARAYNLKVSDAESNLSQSGILIKQERYDESIASSETAKKLASDAISKYEQEQDELLQAKIKAAKIARAEDEKMNNATTKYEVRTGDNLWNIAARSKQMDYNPLLWPLIYNDNQSVIDDPDLITQGMVLHINHVTDKDRLKKAQRHAQTRGNWSLGLREDTDYEYLQQ